MHPSCDAQTALKRILVGNFNAQAYLNESGVTREMRPTSLILNLEKALTHCFIYYTS